MSVVFVSTHKETTTVLAQQDNSVQLSMNNLVTKLMDMLTQPHVPTKPVQNHLVLTDPKTPPMTMLRAQPLLAIAGEMHAHVRMVNNVIIHVMLIKMVKL